VIEAGRGVGAVGETVGLGEGEGDGDGDGDGDGAGTTLRTPVAAYTYVTP
jgi:hypothetical protein